MSVWYRFDRGRTGQLSRPELESAVYSFLNDPIYDVALESSTGRKVAGERGRAPSSSNSASPLSLERSRELLEEERQMDLTLTLTLTLTLNPKPYLEVEKEDPMRDERADQIRGAWDLFSMLDRGGNGLIEISDLAECHDDAIYGIVHEGLLNLCEADRAGYVSAPVWSRFLKLLVIEVGEEEAGSFIGHLLEKAYEIKSPTAQDKERAMEKQGLKESSPPIEGSRRSITLQPGQSVRYTPGKKTEPVEPPREPPRGAYHEPIESYEELHGSPPRITQPDMNFAPAGHEQKKRSEMAMAQQRRDAVRKAAERDRRRAKAARDQKAQSGDGESGPKSGVGQSGVEEVHLGREAWPEKPSHRDVDAVIRSPSPPEEKVAPTPQEASMDVEPWPEKPYHRQSDAVVRSPSPPEAAVQDREKVKQKGTGRSISQSQASEVTYV